MDDAAALVPDVPAVLQHSSGERYWEIDAIRGIAILGMIFFHTLAALVMFHVIVETDSFRNCNFCYLSRGCNDSAS